MAIPKNTNRGAKSLTDFVLRLREDAGRTGSTIRQYSSIAAFPNLGEDNSLYIAQDENALYRWDTATLRYICVGRDWQDIEIIRSI
ncbi:MAG: hypothetical protein KIG68_09415 [Oxalobacter sp.]|nr:hypothetical protein [Oxalobacter sp.]